MSLFKKIISGAVLCSLLLGSYVFASTTAKDIVTIPASASGSTYLYATGRTGNYSYIEERATSIGGGKTSVVAAIYNTSMGKISSNYTLNESNSNFTKLYIAEGYLTVKTMYLGFHGSSNASSSYDAVIEYDLK